MIDRGDLLQLSVTGKGGKVRQVLLPETLSRNLLASRGDAGANDPIFPTRSGKPMTPRGVHAVLERIAKATVTARVSPHWLRHAHASHALDHGATLAEVQATLGHASVGTTSTYLHARPKSSPASSWMRGYSMSEINDARASKSVSVNFGTAYGDNDNQPE